MAEPYEWTATSGGEEYIDSRSLISVLDEINDTPNNLWDDDWTGIKAAIETIKEDVEEWEDGATLIREDCFVGYAEEFARDIGSFDPDAG